VSNTYGCIRCGVVRGRISLPEKMVCLLTPGLPLTRYRSWPYAGGAGRSKVRMKRKAGSG